ncbi:MAG: RNA polymerase sigma factor [Sulfitobacter sp.]
MQEITQPSEDAHAALMARYAGGDAAAARLLVADLGPRVLAHARYMLGDAAEAEDVAQEAMLRLWKIAPDWDAGRAKVTTWLYQVTGNLCVDRMRKRRPSAPLDQVAEPPDPAPGVEAELLTAARNAALEDALQALPERQRQAVVLRHIEGLSNPQIAQIMEIGAEAVESLTARGKRGLAAALASQKDALGFEDDAV